MESNIICGSFHGSQKRLLQHTNVHTSMYALLMYKVIK